MMRVTLCNANHALISSSMDGAVLSLVIPDGAISLLLVIPDGAVSLLLVTPDGAVSLLLVIPDGAQRRAGIQTGLTRVR